MKKVMRRYHRTLILFSYFGDGSEGFSLWLRSERGGGLLVCLVSLVEGSSSFLTDLCWEFSVVYIVL